MRRAQAAGCNAWTAEGADRTTTGDFISELFYRGDEAMKETPKHPQAKLWPSEVVTLGVLFALKGVGSRAFYRWVSRDWRGLFPALPERTRLFRLFAVQRIWTEEFLAAPSVLGVVDSYGIELLHPRREGLSAQQIGRTDKANRRWYCRGKTLRPAQSCGVLVVAWDCAGANAPDTAFPPLIEAFEHEMIVWSDTGFPAKEGDPATLKLRARGNWNTRMRVETVLSMVTGVCHLKKVAHCTWAAFQTRLAFTLATFNLLVQWNRLQPDTQGFVHLSLTEFSL